MALRLINSLLVVFAVCFGVRLGAWLIEPALPLLGGLAFAALILLVLLGGSRSHR